MARMRFTVNTKAFVQMKLDGKIDPALKYHYDEIWYADTEEEQAYMTALPGAMYHPGEICDCPPEGHPKYEQWKASQS